MAWSGVYHFNASDTDFDSHLHIRFYPNREEGFREWFADGTIMNTLTMQKITFKRAFVTMTKTGPELGCIQMKITPGFTDSGRKVFYIDGREHFKE